MHVDDKGKGLRVTIYAGTQGGYILNLCPDWEWVMSAEALPLYSREGTTVPVLGEDGWDPDPWTYVETVKYLAPSGVRTTDRPSRSES